MHALKQVIHTLYDGYERLLAKEVVEGPIPSHIAIIQDGNRRYAAKLGEPLHHGHVYGAQTTEKVLEWCIEIGVKQLTVYTFSTENFHRSYAERVQLYKLFKQKFEEMCTDDRVHSHRARVRAVGNVELFPWWVRKAIKKVERATKDHDGFYLNVALAYGGRQEIVDVARAMARKVAAGELKAENIDEKTISAHLYQGNPINVDLIIRTGGERRMSNFLPWQASGNECAAYFCAPYWPEFRKIDFLRAIRTYQMREEERRHNTVLRVVKLLSECGRAEAEEAIAISKRILNTTRGDIMTILRSLPKSSLPPLEVPDRPQ